MSLPARHLELVIHHALSLHQPPYQTDVAAEDRRRTNTPPPGDSQRLGSILALINQASDTA